MSTNTLDDLLTGGSKSPFGRDANGVDAPVGTSVTGVVKDVQIRQTTDINTKEPQVWPDGNPKQQAVVTIQTTLRDDEDDDGTRSVYIKLWGGQKAALREASQAAKGSPQPGDTFTATLVGIGKRTNPAFNPPKIYKYEIKKGNPLDAIVNTATPSAAGAEQFAAPATDAQKALIQQLIAVAKTDDEIADIVSVPAVVVAGIRLQAAAGAGKGF